MRILSGAAAALKALLVSVQRVCPKGTLSSCPAVQLCGCKQLLARHPCSPSVTSSASALCWEKAAMEEPAGWWQAGNVLLVPFNSDKPGFYYKSSLWKKWVFQFLFFFWLLPKYHALRRTCCILWVCHIFWICCRAVARSACAVGSFSPTSIAFPTVNAIIPCLSLSLFSPFPCSWLAFHPRHPFLGTLEKRLWQSHVSWVLVGIYLAHHSLTCSWEEIVLPGPSTDSMREHFHRIETEVCLWQIKPTLDLLMSWTG